MVQDQDQDSLLRQNADVARRGAARRYAESVRPMGDKFVHIEYGLHAIPVFNELGIFLIKWHLNCFHRVFQTLGDCLRLVHVSPSRDLNFALLLVILNVAHCAIWAESEKIAQRATRELPLVSCA